MSLAHNIAWNALADFFAVAEPQRAHWYLIKGAIEGEAYCQDLNSVFPSLSLLLSMRDKLLNGSWRNIWSCVSMAQYFIPIATCFGEFYCRIQATQ
jgi:hypothetical protein